MADVAGGTFCHPSGSHATRIGTVRSRGPRVPVSGCNCGSSGFPDRADGSRRRNRMRLGENGHRAACADRFRSPRRTRPAQSSFPAVAARCDPRRALGRWSLAPRLTIAGHRRSIVTRRMRGECTRSPARAAAASGVTARPEDREPPANLRAGPWRRQGPRTSGRRDGGFEDGPTSGRAGVGPDDARAGRAGRARGGRGWCGERSERIVAEAADGAEHRRIRGSRR